MMNMSNSMERSMSQNERSMSMTKMSKLGLNDTLARLESALMQASKAEDQLQKDLDFSFVDEKLE